MAIISNPDSGAGHKLQGVHLPARWTFSTGQIDWQSCLEADLIVMLGGDGTLQHTVTELLNLTSTRSSAEIGAIPPLAILPFGTTNMSAQNINHTHNRRRALEHLASLMTSESAAELTTRRLPLLEIDTSQSRLYGYCFGLGAITGAVKDWRQHRRQAAAVNQLRSLLVMLQGLRDTRSSTRVAFAGETLNVYALLVTTLGRLLYGCQPFWGSARDGTAPLRCTWIESGVSGLLKSAPAFLRGAPRLAGEPGFESHGLAEARLSFEGSFILDGEVYESTGAGLTITPSDTLRWVSL